MFSAQKIHNISYLGPADSGGGVAKKAPPIRIAPVFIFSPGEVFKKALIFDQW